MAKLPLIRLKIRLQHNSLPFLPPASHFSAFCDSGMHKNQNFEIAFGQESDLRPQAFRVLEFYFSPFLFLFSFATVIDLLLGLLAVKKTSKKASTRRPTFSMEQPGVVAREILV